MVLETAKLDPRFPQTNQTKVGGARGPQGGPPVPQAGALLRRARAAPQQQWPASTTTMQLAWSEGEPHDSRQQTVPIKQQQQAG